MVVEVKLTRSEISTKIYKVMEEKDKQIKVNDTTKWACLANAVITLLLAILCAIAGVNYLNSYSISWAYSVLGFVYIVAVIFLLVMPILVFISYKKGSQRMVQYSYLVGLFVSALMAITLSLIGIGLIQLEGNHVLAITLNLIGGVLYFAAFICLGIASLNAANQLSTKVSGTAGSIIFAIGAVSYLIISVTASEIDVTSILISIALLAMAILLYAISKLSTIQIDLDTKKDATDDSLDQVEHELDESSSTSQNSPQNKDE